MKMNNLILTAAVVATSMLVACSPSAIAKFHIDNHVSVSNGKETDATIKKIVRISEFDEIYATQGIKVVFSQGQNPGTAKIATTPSAKKYLCVEVKDGTLQAFYKSKKKNVDIKGPSIIYVSSPTLHEVELSSSACLDVTTDLKVGNDLDIDISSVASVTVGDVYCNEMDIEASSSAKFKCGSVNGNVLEFDLSSSATANCNSFTGKSFKIDLSSSAQFNCSSFRGENLTIDASSTAKTKIQNIDCQSIYVDASSLADIILAGKTHNLSHDISSGAKLNTQALQTR